MKTLRALGLTGAILLSTLATASAATNCHIECMAGGVYDLTVSTYSECCGQFGSLCGSEGDAWFITSTGFHKYCPSIG